MLIVATASFAAFGGIEGIIEHTVVVSESKNAFGKLLVHPPRDDFSVETRKCRVTLLWSPADAVKVFKDREDIMNMP